MPQFLFTLAGEMLDEVGVDLIDARMARIAALRFLGRLLFDHAAAVEAANSLRLDVSGESAKPVCSLLLAIAPRGSEIG